MPKGFFITGTDTGVGKTIVAGTIIRALTMLGLNPFAMKPVETGVATASGTPVRQDGSFLKWISGMEEGINHITPYCFREPLAPLIASEDEGVDIDPRVIKKEFTALSAKYGSAVVEGVGGLLVPFRTDYFVSDLAADIGLPLIVVTRPILGTINHTLLTVRYALREGLRVAGVIINHSRLSEGTIAEETNPDVLKRLLPVPIIGVVPHLLEISPESLDKVAVKNLRLDVIKEALKS